MTPENITEAIAKAIYDSEGGWQNPDTRMAKAVHAAEIVYKKLDELDMIKK